MGLLLAARGLKGASAANFVRNNRNSIRIPWAVAQREFQEREMVKWEARLDKALPNTDLLQPDSYGALVSLAYNRGTSFDLPGPRYLEMRSIKLCMAAKKFNEIPAHIRSMKRLWNNGLVARREREALLFEKGLKAAIGVRNQPSIPTHGVVVVRNAVTIGALSGAGAGALGVMTSPVAHVQWFAPLAILTIGTIAACVSLHVTRHRLLPKADP